MHSFPCFRYKVAALILFALLIFMMHTGEVARADSTQSFLLLAQSDKKPADAKPTVAAPKGSETPAATQDVKTSLPKTKVTAKESPSATPASTESATPAASVEPSKGAASTVSPTPAAGGEPSKPGFDLQKYILPIAAGAGGIIVVVILLAVLLKKKPKHVCERCGKDVLPGMVYCEDCADQRTTADKSSTSAKSATTAKSTTTEEMKAVEKGGA